MTTSRNDLARTGQNRKETILTPANVNPTQFGKLFSHAVDGQIYAQPLYLPSVSIPGKGMHNVVFVATEHDSVYAFDADSDAGPNAAPLWRVSFLDPAAGVGTVGAADISGCSMITPELGITGTPVIDPGTDTLYVVAMTKENGSFFQRLHALDVATGTERPGSPVPIQASVPGSGDPNSPGEVRFYPQRYRNRAGLLLVNGAVYTCWASHCDQGSYHGWLIGYDAKTLRQTSVFNTTPNGYRASLWMGGAAPAADGEGNIYVISGNGGFDGDTLGSNFGDSFLKISPTGRLAPADYFTPFNQAHLDEADIDLGSSGAVLLPESAGSADHPRLLVGAGKEGRIYVLDRQQMGKFASGSDSQIVQSLAGAIKSLFGGLAYYHNTLYFSAWNDALKAFPIVNAQMASVPASQTRQVFGYPGSVPSISANGDADAIVWTVESGAGGTLHAYDASNLANELYSSQMKSSRDALGTYVKFSVPTVANGKVFAGTANSLVVFGLLGQGPPPSLSAVVNAASFQPGPVAPGSLISIFGSHLARDSKPGGVALTINGVPAPLLYAGSGQINAQIPFEMAAGPATAVLQIQGLPPAAVPLSIAPAAPGVFGNGRSGAAVQNVDGTFNDANHPAKAGSVVTVYLTGLGAVTPSVPTGTAAPAQPLAYAVLAASASIGGVPASISFAGLTPGSIGVSQVNLRVPMLAGGAYPVAISVNGAAGNTVFLNVAAN